MLFSQSEIIEKERRARELLEKKGLAALALTTQANFAWATCGGDNHVGIASDLGNATALITPDRKYIICDNIEAARILDEEAGDKGFEVVSYAWYQGNLADKIRELTGPGEIGADTPIPGTLYVEPDLAPYRYSLTSEEIERYRWVGKNSAEAMSDACGSVEIGMTEHEIASLLGAGLLERGLSPTLILTAVDERIAKYRHPIPTEKELERYAMLVIGAKRWGLTVSMTRLVHFGELSEDLSRRHEAVAQVDAVMIAETVPGAVVGDIFRAGVDEYTAQGFMLEWTQHHQGGPTGYKGREYRATMETSDTVQENQAFAWNPSITGTKSEDTMIATAAGPEIISEIEGWPSLEVEIDGRIIERPDILVL